MEVWYEGGVLKVIGNKDPCISSFIDKWRKEGLLEWYSTRFTVANVTLRPAIAFPFAVLERSDDFGHGILVKTKDSNLLYIGRVSPNWLGVYVAQAGFVRGRFVGRAFKNDELGIINMGIVGDWVNPLIGRRVNVLRVPLYTENVSRHIKSRKWNYVNGYYEGRSVRVTITRISRELPRVYTDVKPVIGAVIQSGDCTSYGDVGIVAGSDGKWVPIADFGKMTVDDVVEYLRGYVDLEVVDSTIPGVEKHEDVVVEFVYEWYPIKGVGELVSFAERVLGRVREEISKQGFEDSLRYVDECFLSIANPNEDFYKNVVDVAECAVNKNHGSFTMSFTFGSLISVIYEEVKDMYGKDIAKFVYTWSPITGDDIEAWKNAEELVNIGKEVYEKAKEELVKCGDVEALECLGYCLVNCSPYLEGEIDEKAKNVACCAVLTSFEGCEKE
ncbi:hypothetical protein [Stygiolobus caldivivus]|uniref:Uncharacterized protein n=1 Tax=Stygiolobus caldivivus TaxID=2824673 RepID=A0A8D5U8R3_9CREN|nr:hypothetical protein [Stygiolobus caldivivus]BCU71120.1 hypothetical protein KN1_24170 [Stygiolobus caldivivus]